MGACSSGDAMARHEIAQLKIQIREMKSQLGQQNSENETYQKQMIEKALVEKYDEASEAMGDLQSMVLKLEQSKKVVKACQETLADSSEVVGDSVPVPLPTMPEWMTVNSASLACFYGTGMVRVAIERASDGVRYEVANMVIERRDWFGQVALLHAGDKVQLRGGNDSVGWVVPFGNVVQKSQKEGQQQTLEDDQGEMQ